MDISVDEWEQAIGDADPNKKSRSITTRVNVGMGECIVLGGLSKDNDIVAGAAVPILSQIPIIGLLFKYKSSSVAKTHLYTFIRPSLMKPMVGTVPDDYTRFKLDYAKLNTKRYDSYANSRDPVEKFIFSRTEQSQDEVRGKGDARYPELDDFWQRKSFPLSSDVARDPYYRVSWMAKEKWAKPEKAKKPGPNASTIGKLKKRRVFAS